MKKVFLLLVALICICEQPLFAFRNNLLMARDQVPDPTLLVAIQALGAQIKEIIEKAQAAGEILEVEAANQIATVIDQAKTTLNYEMNVAVSQLDAVGMDIFNSLTSLVNDFINHAYQDIIDIERRAQAIMHIIPFSKHFPQVYDWTPSYTYKNAQTYLSKLHNWSDYIKVKRVSQSSNSQSMARSGELESTDSIHVDFEGDFYDLPHKKFNAELTVNGTKFLNTVKTGDQVGFVIPTSALVYEETKINYNYVTLDIPYKKTVFLFFFKKAMAEFKVPIITLPKSVGTLNIKTTVKVPGVIVQQFRPGPYAQISDRDDIKCGGEHADLAIHCIPVEPGWRIQPTSVSYQMITSEGDWYPCGPDHSGLADACYSFSTIHHPWGTSGKILFYITYNGEKDVLVDQSVDNNVPISWGIQKVFKIPDGGTYIATYTGFDGKPVEFSGPYENNYLKVSQTMGTLSIVVKP